MWGRRWTLDTLHEHVQVQLGDLRTLLGERKQAQETGVNAALLAAEKAVAKAETAAEKRFESVNEFRAQLTDQAATFQSREAAELEARRTSEKLQELNDRINRSEGKGLGLHAALAYVLASSSVLVSLFLLAKGAG